MADKLNVKGTLSWSREDVAALKIELGNRTLSEVCRQEYLSATHQKYLSFYQLDIACKQHHYYAGFLSVQSQNIATQIWKAHTERVGTVFIYHGLFDHTGLFNHLIDALLADGFTVVSIDFPGHGLSSGSKKLVYNFSEYADLIDSVVNQLTGWLIDEKDRLFFVGQSTGAAAVVSYCLKYGEQRVARSVLLAPLVRTTGWLKIRILYTLLNRILHFVPRSFSAGSNDPRFNYFLTACDVMQTRKISVRWVGAMLNWDRFLKDSVSRGARLSIPTLLVQGNRDTTVDAVYNVPFLEGFNDSLAVEWVNGAMHHLVNESPEIRAPLFRKIAAFLKN